jgi:Ca2+-binding RTX toxin-like protein
MAVIYGTQGRDFLEGMGLDDIIQGWAKFGDQSTDLSDQLIGGGGNDELSGGDDRDQLEGGDGDDTLSGGDGADRLSGDEDDDQLDGGQGDDQLEGGDGGDVLKGERGDDRLEGGDGRDRFEFSRTYDTDRIVDFKDDVDTIVLDGARLGVTSKADALSLATVVNGNTVFTFDTGDVLIVENIADPNLLANDIDIF